MKSSGRNEDKEDSSHDRCRKEAVAGTAPIGGSAGQRQSQGAQSQNAKAHLGGRDFGKSAAGSANDRAVCTGGLSDTEAAAARLNPLGDLRETGGLPLFSPEGRTYSPPAKAGGGSPPVGRARALFTKRLSAASPERAGNAASGHCLCSRLPYFA